jgi:hypothetical protein
MALKQGRTKTLGHLPHDAVVRVDKRVKEVLARQEAAPAAPAARSRAPQATMTQGSAIGADPASLVLRCIASLAVGRVRARRGRG